jgi:hypothetical protein
MKMIEALKEKKLNSKKVGSILSDIQKYASLLSTEKPAFDSEKEQREYVKSLVQSAIDLLNRRAKLKCMIDRTNLETKIRIPKGLVTPEHEISIAEALMFKLSYTEYIGVFNSLNRTAASMKMRGAQSVAADGTKIQEVQLYDENWKNNSIKDLNMKFNHIDAHLEMLNATVDIIE